MPKPSHLCTIAWAFSCGVLQRLIAQGIAWFLGFSLRTVAAGSTGEPYRIGRHQHLPPNEWNRMVCQEENNPGHGCNWAGAWTKVGASGDLPLASRPSSAGEVHRGDRNPRGNRRALGELLTNGGSSFGIKFDYHPARAPGTSEKGKKNGSQRYIGYVLKRLGKPI